MVSPLRQVWFLPTCCLAAVLALPRPAGAQVTANQPVGSVTAASSVEAPASAPTGNAKYQELEGRELRKRPGTTSSFGGLSGQGRSSSMASLWLQTAVVLGIVLAAMWLVLKWLRKRGIGVSFGGSNSPVQVLNRGYLTGKHQMVLVRFGSRVLLLGVSPQGVNVLSEMTNPEEAAQVLGRLEGVKAGSASSDFQQAISEAADEYAEPVAAAAPVVQTPSREQIGEIRSEIRGLLDKMQSLGKKPQG